MNCWVVVVDDEIMSLTNAKIILKDEGMRVDRLRSGRDLLKFMTKNKPDLILMDVMMPEMDGFQTYHKLRQYEEETGRKRTPVIF
ncbi:PleD family two-component system response regulator [Anaerovibrio sp. RM50]|uniref:response regulator n=1 Tax=Anaerovibrio sp. RM50 TaxID=1200557 RepID=UPI0006880CD7|nr:response regulator [Anaerovibrio sp. RM50]